MSDPKDIILNAIRVLRSRRVRPSDAKIAWLARREFLQREDVTTEVLKELVQCGDVSRVIYKGAASYRVAPHKVAASNKLLKPVPKKLKFTPTPTDILRPLLSAIAACGDNATKDRIAEQLVLSGHRHLVDRLDTILQKELRVGLIGKNVVMTPGQRSVAEYVITKNAPLALISNAYQGNSFSDEGLSDQDTPPDEEEEDGSSKSSTPFQHLHNHLKKLQQEKEKDPSKESDENEIEDEGTEETFSPIPEIEEIEKPEEENDLNEIPFEEPKQSPEESIYVTRRGRPRKAPSIYAEQSFTVPKKDRARSGKMCTQRGGKIKKARKVYDPSSSVGNGKSGKSTPVVPSAEPGHICGACGQPSSTSNAFEELLVCHNCSARAHPSCLGYSNELALKCRLAPWTCMDCKHCTVCHMDHNNGTLIFCDECDRAYHLTCHNPPIQGQPTGSWICQVCSPTPASQNFYDSLSGLPTPSNSPVPDDENRSSSGSWDVAACDPRIPNAMGWEVDNVVDYFTEKGFGHLAHVFREQDIDGTALLMLTRSDVLTGLNLKLGPALKIYKQVRIIQTRLSNPPLP